jgi:hypothetical protein
VFAGEQTAPAGVDRLLASAAHGRTGASTMTTCLHRPACPPADAPDSDSARVVLTHPDQGWSMLCNGVLVFDELPAGEPVPA